MKRLEGEPNGVLNWSSSFAAVAREMYALLEACPRRALLACSTVNPRHPLPQDHLDLVGIARNLSSSSIELRPPVLERARLFVRSLAFAAREIAHIAYLRVWYRRDLQARFGSSATVVMKTWLVSSPSEDGRDFYFGRLPQMLGSSGLPCMLVGGESGRTSGVRFAREVILSETKVMPERALIPLWAPAAIVVDQVVTSLRLSKLSRNSQMPLFSAVASRASLECLGPATFTQYLQFFIAKRAVELWRPAVYATLYEGQPWEKLAWLGAKAANPACLTMGYQHTIVMPYSLGLISPHAKSWETPAPDIVLGTGSATVALMKEGHRGIGTKAFATLGSFRRKSAENGTRIPEPDRRVVLVVPEGIMKEAVLLFTRAAEAAQALPDHRFVFRCHPVLPFARVRPHLPIDVDSLPNVEISNRTAIEEDFDRSSSMLYRGSSVVLYGVLAGLKPYYFDEPGFPCVDPLYPLSGWRESAESVARLVTLLRDYVPMDIRLAHDSWQPAKSFADDYVSRVDERGVAEIARILAIAARKREESVHCHA